VLDRGRDREVRVGHDLEPRPGLAPEGFRSGDDAPGQLELRERAALGEPTEAERQRRAVTGDALGAVRVVGEGIVREHLVRYEGQAALRAEGLESLKLVPLEERAGGVVRVHHHDRAGARSESTNERRGVQVPPAVVLESVRRDPDRLEVRQVLEQRVAGPRDQDLVARVAQQLEKEGVGLARARGEQDAVGIDLTAAPRMVRRHRFARATIRVDRTDARPATARVRHAPPRDDPLDPRTPGMASRPPPLGREGRVQAVGRKVPAGASGEHLPARGLRRATGRTGASAGGSSLEGPPRERPPRRAPR